MKRSTIFVIIGILAVITAWYYSRKNKTENRNPTGLLDNEKQTLSTKAITPKRPPVALENKKLFGLADISNVQESFIPIMDIRKIITYTK